MLRTDVLTLATSDNARLAGVLYSTPRTKRGIGTIIMHPVVDFHQHYAARPLADRGVDVLCLNSRYTRFEHAVVMERLLLDMAAGVQFLRERGCAKIALIGNSGGGPLVAFYQSQAESPSITATPDGRPFELKASSLSPADALIELNGHRGRHHFLTMHLDPSVIDEADMVSCDPTLNMYDLRNGPPYERSWLAHYREAQIARNERITNWALQKLESLKAVHITAQVAQAEVLGQQLAIDAMDMPFVVHRTMADPRTLDLSIEPNDRKPGTVWGPPQPLNWSVTALGRITSLRSWLSQYSWSRSAADGPKCIARTTVPLLIVLGTAEQGCYLSDGHAYLNASPVSDKTLHPIKGGTHFMRDQTDKINEVTNAIDTWLKRRFA